MVSATVSDAYPAAAKVLVAGGFGVGKTTFVGSVSEITPLRTEELLTAASVHTDPLNGVEDKLTTTVAMDFGRITIDDSLTLYVFGTPGQERFWFMWEELSQGALGAIVLADTRRLGDCFAAVDYVESRGMDFLVAVNQFDGAYVYRPEEVAAALDLKPHVPVVMCDARQGGSATRVLLSLVDHVVARHAAAAATTPF